MEVLWSKHVLSLCHERFFSVGENLRGGFEQNICQLSRCIFNVLMSQNDAHSGV